VTGTETADLSEARDRLLHAWRGEIIAGSVYELIARRMPEREADILRRMSEAEAGHRRRLEERMHELGVVVPDPASVKVPVWLRLQARIAPVDRLLAAREAAEDEEVSDTYRRTTGDADTDALLREIRREERTHSRAVADMRSNGDGAGVPSAPQFAAPHVQERLTKLLGREKWHQTGGGWISGAIYGANDGLAAVFGIVAGVSGATGGSSFVLTAGAAGAIASALSMATGAFLAERSEAEVMAANVERERQEISEHPEEEKEELSLFYQLKGIDEATADELAEQLSKNGRDAARALTGGVRVRRGRRRPEAGRTRRGGQHRARGDRPGDPVLLHDRHGRDRDGGDRLAGGALPGRRGEVARDAPVLVVGGARDDARRDHRRRRNVPGRARTADVAVYSGAQGWNWGIA
jgi:rubrerythrin